LDKIGWDRLWLKKGQAMGFCLEPGPFTKRKNPWTGMVLGWAHDQFLLSLVGTLLRTPQAPFQKASFIAYQTGLIQ